MKSNLKINLIIVSLLFAICITSFSSCGKDDSIEISSMSLEELEECVTVCDYKGLELLLDTQTKEDALVTYIYANSNIKKYPTGAVNYYAEQLKSQYRYYADQADMKYEEMLDKLGEDNVTINAEAKRLVKKDLIFELIRKKEAIALTDEEKAQFFDKYVKKYAESYKYSEEYVRDELSELVYDSMLYDKTIEFLIINNSFVESD